jgi:hypothetical protein
MHASKQTPAFYRVQLRGKNGKLFGEGFNLGDTYEDAMRVARRLLLEDWDEWIWLLNFEPFGGVRCCKLVFDIVLLV